MADMRLVTYCGLYCGLCAQCNRIPKQAAALRETMRREGWEFWGPEIPAFETFWKFLSDLVEAGTRSSCREGAGACGPSFCDIRACAQEKRVEVCPFCEEYPCARIEALAERYVMLLADGKRMREIGLERWIAEQEDRRSTGFVYADIRCTPLHVSEK
ncbi:MAG: DUF3795 domain-containing protein [Chloroflexi bacterium]|nr:DUF3795 domain-containing protein [Chloroflexota bacterium]